MDFLPLPRGATGLRHVRDEPLPFITLDDARRAIGTMLAPSGAITFEPDPKPWSVKSFYDLRVRQRASTLRVLVHRTHPWIVFADAGLRFVAPPRDALPPSPFVLVPLEVLGHPADAAALSRLARAEMQQVAYWKPRTVGDVVFQHWD
ncbi:hypothetical protein [Sandaracinus amylolyticus]|uniref:hypothetical protein n=1 Tax=Sandaracinus amylolyticus TaxID=927083 RepID=UPI001F36D57B|nr:hypothetical protein [Sandaracinus amylolyticus]UJR82013.1 Hypothetical protein I5071_40780 [Sandaracinus amylolyticus]